MVKARWLLKGVNGFLIGWEGKILLVAKFEQWRYNKEVVYKNESNS